MKILWHMPLLRKRSCGLSRRALCLARELRDRGHDVGFIVDGRKTDIQESRVEGFELIRCAVPSRTSLHWSLQSRTKLRLASDLIAQGLRERDLFITCQPEAAIAYRRVFRRQPLIFVCGGSVLLHEHAQRREFDQAGRLARSCLSLDLWLKRKIERDAMRCCDAVVFDSDSTCRLATQRHRLDSRRCHPILGGMNAQKFVPPTPGQREDTRRSLGIAAQDGVVVWTGRLSPEKNVAFLLQAVARCRHRPLRVLLVGDGPERKALMDLRDQLLLEGIVEFIGDRSDVRPYLHAADVFAFPSRGESFGGSLAEAMACGVAPLALRPDGRYICNANEEIIEDGVCGLLVPADGPEAFAAAIDRVLGEPELRNSLAREAARVAQRKFNWNGAGQLLNKLVMEVMNHRAGIPFPPPAQPVLGSS